MEEEKLSAAELAEFGEFKRSRREAEIAFTLKKLVIDASRRENDRATLKHACDCAIKLHASGVLVSPVNVSKAKKNLSSEVAPPVCCLVGGTGESLPAVKKAEAKRALRQGARHLRLVLCYSALIGGNAGYLKREIKRVRRVVRRGTLTVSLEDHSLGEQEVEFGVKAAVAGRADGVCVRGETSLVECAVRAGGGRLFVEASGVENAEQLRFLFQAGAVRASTGNGEKIAEELYSTIGPRRSTEGGSELPALPQSGPPAPVVKESFDRTP